MPKFSSFSDFCWMLGKSSWAREGTADLLHPVCGEPLVLHHWGTDPWTVWQMWRHQAHHHGSGQGEENALRILFCRVSLLFKSSKRLLDCLIWLSLDFFRFSLLIRINYVLGKWRGGGYTVKYNFYTKLLRISISTNSSEELSDFYCIKSSV